jgi:hypothetical protein
MKCLLVDDHSLTRAVLALLMAMQPPRCTATCWRSSSMRPPRRPAPRASARMPA